MLLSSSFFTSCDFGSDQIDGPTEILLNETPDVLDDDQGRKLDYISKSRDRDIISKLLQEALAKNEDLKDLNERIEQMHEAKTDSLEQFKTYKETNNRFWKSAKIRLGQIQDTTLRKSTKLLFQELQQKYESSLTNLNNREKQIHALENSLIDQVKVMKLMIAQGKMENYQKNEKPDIARLENLVETYTELIEEIKAQSK